MRERIPRREEWAALLNELTQLDDGRIYARDLPELGAALTDLFAAYSRRSRRRYRRYADLRGGSGVSDE